MYRHAVRMIRIMRPRLFDVLESVEDKEYVGGDLTEVEDQEIYITNERTEVFLERYKDICSDEAIKNSKLPFPEITEKPTKDEINFLKQCLMSNPGKTTKKVIFFLFYIFLIGRIRCCSTCSQKKNTTTKPY